MAERMARQSLLTTWMISSEREREPDSSPKRSRIENEPLLDSSTESTSTEATRLEPYRLSTEARLDSCCQPYDIGTITEFVRHLNREDKFRALNNIYKPPPNYVFPQHKEGAGNHQRSFQQKWMNEYAWLAYSREKDGGYCVPCVFFCKGDEGLGKLVNSPLTRFKDAVETFRQHSKKAYHVHSVSDMLTFLRIMNNEQTPIDHQLVSAVAQQVQQNRELLKSIINTVIFCGKQNVALRGHRDDRQHLQQPGNHGNFHAFLNFRIESGDKNLQTHLEKAPLNARYTSKTIQNDIIACCGDHIREKVLTEVRKAKYFSILADEVADVSNTEQLSLVLRFVDENNQIREEFVDFLPCTNGTSGQALADMILERVRGYQLDPVFIRGQGYDGAGNMSGKFRGCAALISQSCPKAVYVHCYSHVLNLCIAKACDLQVVRNVIGTLNQVCIFFNTSPKRQAQLEQVIGRMPESSNRKTLVDQCRTRWVARHDSFHVFGKLYEAIVETFEEIISPSNHQSWNNETVTSANSLKVAITQWQFLIGFVVAKKGLEYAKVLSVSLQLRAKDIAHAFTETSNVIKALEQIRNDVDVTHLAWHEEALLLGSKIGVIPSVPRRCGRQCNRDNMPAEYSESYYRRTLTIPFLDQLIMEMNARFSDTQRKAVLGLSLVPAAMEKDWRAKAQELAEFYRDDLPDADNLSVELHCWQLKWDGHQGEKPSDPNQTLPHADCVFFQNIRELLKITCTLPVTSCECERSNSALKRLKTYLRSTMGHERLSGLALLAVHYDMEIDCEHILNHFAQKNPRRMQLDLTKT